MSLIFRRLSIRHRAAISRNVTQTITIKRENNNFMFFSKVSVKGACAATSKCHSLIIFLELIDIDIFCNVRGQFLKGIFYLQCSGYASERASSLKQEGQHPLTDRTARRQFQATGQPVSRTQASDAMTSRLPR